MTSNFMAEAIAAGERVRGTTSPNPWVGAVLVRDGHVIATGATSPAGGPHAEAAALAGIDARGADMYVTLEPCAPFEGKRTRPCAEAIIEAGVTRVVVALEDFDPRVGGRGLAAMRGAGIAVEVGDGRHQALASLRPYIKHRTTGLPYVVAKFAATLDGRTATGSGDSKWITSVASRERGHRERAKVDAVVVGIGTVLADDPALTARPGGELAAHQPARVVLDSRGQLSLDAQILRGPGQCIVATTREADGRWKDGVRGAGATVIECERGEHGIELRQLLRVLATRSILSVWVEGGGTLLGSFFDHDLVDETWAFIAPLIMGGDGRPAVGGKGVELVADAHRLRQVVVESIGEDVLVRGYTGAWDPSDPAGASEGVA